MKLCKYCKKPGTFDPVMRKVLCEEHKDIYLNLRSVWQAIADLQLSAGSKY
jgi:hypothetical protein|tara:strand:- start:27152 stop:27304 length:153 start_codon:yes stop_codon:yes gene_type:complete